MFKNNSLQSLEVHVHIFIIGVIQDVKVHLLVDLLTVGVDLPGLQQFLGRELYQVLQGTVRALGIGHGLSGALHSRSVRNRPHYVSGFFPPRTDLKRSPFDNLRLVHILDPLPRREPGDGEQFSKFHLDPLIVVLRLTLTLRSAPDIGRSESLGDGRSSFV